MIMHRFLLGLTLRKESSHKLKNQYNFDMHLKDTNILERGAKIVEEPLKGKMIYNYTKKMNTKICHNGILWNVFIGQQVMIN